MRDLYSEFCLRDIREWQVQGMPSCLGTGHPRMGHAPQATPSASRAPGPFLPPPHSPIRESGEMSVLNEWPAGDEAKPTRPFHPFRLIFGGHP